MTIGMVLDHCEEFAVASNPDLKADKKADNKDIQAFKGR